MPSNKSPPASCISILGLGYVGLPTALALARTGVHILGVDINPDLLSRLRNGECPIAEPEIPEWLADSLRKCTLQLTLTPTPSDVFIICVPTPFNPKTHESDLRAIISAARSIAPVLQKGNLVILESTVPVGTTENVLAPILETSGLTATRDFSLAFCPERILPGNTAHELVHNDRILGGDTEATRQRLLQLYGRFVKGRMFTTSIRTAEFVKLVENTYRAVNIGLSNELLLLAQGMGVDVWEAIELANRHPRVNLMSPGPGVGGHCIPVDPWFLVQDQTLPGDSVIRSAMERNEAMPGVVKNDIRKLLKENGKTLKGANVALLGAAYKGGTEDARESPTSTLHKLLIRAGAKVRVYDPLVTRFTTKVEKDPGPIIKWCDIAVAMVDHEDIKAIIWKDILPTKGKRPIILDTRGLYRDQSDPRIRRFGR